MTVLSILEWDAIVIGALLGYLIGWFWFSDKAFGKAYQQEAGAKAKSASMRQCMAVEAVSNLALATLVAIVLSAFSATYYVGAAWLWAVVVTIVAVNSTVGANNFWQGHSFRFVAINNGYHAAQVVVMALAYVYVEKFM